MSFSFMIYSVIISFDSTFSFLLD